MTNHNIFTNDNGELLAYNFDDDIPEDDSLMSLFEDEATVAIPINDDGRLRYTITAHPQLFGMIEDTNELRYHFRNGGTISITPEFADDIVTAVNRINELEQTAVNQTTRTTELQEQIAANDWCIQELITRIESLESELLEHERRFNAL